MDGTVKLVSLLLVITVAKAAVPGSYFWKPRLGLDLAVPTTLKPARYQMSVLQRPTVNEIKGGTAVIVNGYQVGLTVLALSIGIKQWENFPHLNPFKAWFYTTAYRWALRHLSLIPLWLQGGGNRSIIDIHRVWRRRYWYSDKFIPPWLQWFLPHVWEFDREKKHYRRFIRYVLPAFQKHFHYPGVEFDDFKSEDTTESIENLDLSDFSIDIHGADY